MVFVTTLLHRAAYTCFRIPSTLSLIYLFFHSFIHPETQPFLYSTVDAVEHLFDIQGRPSVNFSFERASKYSDPNTHSFIRSFIHYPSNYDLHFLIFLSEFSRIKTKKLVLMPCKTCLWISFIQIEIKLNHLKI